MAWFEEADGRIVKAKVGEEVVGSDITRTNHHESIVDPVFKVVCTIDKRTIVIIVTLKRLLIACCEGVC